MLWIVVLFPGINEKGNLKAVEAYGRGVSMLFVQNAGQLSDDVVYYSMHPSVVYILRDGTVYINGVRVSFGSSPKFIIGDIPIKTKISYFGKSRAISNVPTYRRVVLKEVYPKIDAILTADGRGIVEFQFIVHPGGDPHRIKVETDGRVVQREGGIYIVKEGKELVRISDLKAYQGAEEVEIRAVLSPKNLKFEVWKYNHEHTLVIDPIVTSILASSSYDYSTSMAIDSSGNVFIAGYTANSSEFSSDRTFFGVPSTPYDSAAFVSKLSGDLTEHIATAILTSSGYDRANGIAIDRNGSVFIAGYTARSGDFAPSRNVFGTSDGRDAFVSKLSNDLTTHIATAILASSDNDGASHVAIDSDGYVFVVGSTDNSSDFAPSRDVLGASDGRDVFVSKLSNDLTVHIATSILASSDWDYARFVAIDSSGNVIIAGRTDNFDDFAPSRNIFGTTGSGDVFISKLGNDLTTHIATAILASSGIDSPGSMAMDGNGNIFITGYTWGGSNFAPSRRIFGTIGGPSDAFVSKLSNDLNTHIATAILTSDSIDFGRSVAVDSLGNVFVVGFTENSSNFAPDRNIFGTLGYEDAFVSKINNSLTEHITTAVLTSSNYDFANFVAIDRDGEVIVVGGTFHFSDFPGIKYLFGTPGGLHDIFISKLPNTLSISEKPTLTVNTEVELSNGALVFTLHTSSYAGFDLYSTDGRLIKRVSLGYLPAGRYEYRLKLPRGAYLLKVRVGDEVRELKGVM